MYGQMKSASDAKVDRERPQKSAYFEESAELYAEVSRPLIEAQLAKDEAKLRAKLGASDTIHSKIGWLHNVLKANWKQRSVPCASGSRSVSGPSERGVGPGSATGQGALRLFTSYVETGCVYSA